MRVSISNDKGFPVYINFGVCAKRLVYNMQILGAVYICIDKVTRKMSSLIIFYDITFRLYPF